MSVPSAGLDGMHRQFAGKLTSPVTKWVVAVLWILIAAGGATFGSKGRTVSILPRSIGDRALVIYSDLPDAMGSNVVDPAGITLGK